MRGIDGRISLPDFLRRWPFASALFHRLKTGEGQTIEYFNAGLHLAFNIHRIFPALFPDGQIPVRVGNGHAGMIPGNLYPPQMVTSSFVLAYGPNTQALYCLWAGADLIIHPGGQTRACACSTGLKSTAVISEWTKSRKTGEIVDILKKAEVPVLKIAPTSRGPPATIPSFLSRIYGH